MMGAQLVSRVYTSWTHLPDRPFRLLAYMALIAHDSHKQPTFWGGRDDMCDALGMAEYTPSQYAMVKRAVRHLVTAGAIERAYIGHHGKRTEYRLLVQKGNSGVTPKGNSPVPPDGNSGVTPKGVLHGSPKEPTEEYREEINSVSAEGKKATAPVSTASESRLAHLRLILDGSAS